jgi:peptide/nickel transport system permease protein
VGGPVGGPAQPEAQAPGLARYVGRQLWYRARQLVILLLGISTLLFLLLHATGDPAVVIAGEGATPAQIQQVEEFYGLNEPVAVQYGVFVSKLARLDFGRSFSNQREALPLVLERMPATISLAGLAVVINLFVSLFVGAYLGYRPERADRRATLVGVLVSQGIPAFVIGLLLIQLFAVELRWLPSIGREGLVSYLLPAVSLASFLLPRTIRLTATNVQDAMAQQYVRTARAGGASAFVVLWRHAIPNALLGTIALVGVQFGFLMGGSLVIESLFSWPGLGSLMIQAVRTVDFPVIQASVFVVAALVFGITALVDVILPMIDPRLRERMA